MRLALEMASRAEAEGEVPVGAVVAVGDEVIATGWNRPIAASDPTAHAEIEALRKASEKMTNYRLPSATLYVTLEPCPMCAGAIVAARVKEVVFGARDLRFGGIRSKFRIADSELLNHRAVVREGLLAAECGQLLTAFFESRRM